MKIEGRLLTSQELRFLRTEDSIKSLKFVPHTEAYAAPTWEEKIRFHSEKLDDLAHLPLGEFVDGLDALMYYGSPAQAEAAYRYDMSRYVKGRRGLYA